VIPIDKSRLFEPSVISIDKKRLGRFSSTNSQCGSDITMRASADGSISPERQKLKKKKTVEKVARSISKA